MISHKRNRATTKAGIESETRFVQDHRLHDNGRAGLDRDSSSRLSSFDGRQLVGRKSGQS